MKKGLILVLMAAMMLMTFTACEGEKAYIGKWTINEVSAGDISMTSEDMKDMGLQAGFVKMQKSGKAVVNLLGDEYEGTWEMNEDGSGVNITYNEDMKGTATLDGKVLTFIDAQGSVYTATRF